MANITSWLMAVAAGVVGAAAAIALFAAGTLVFTYDFPYSGSQRDVGVVVIAPNLDMYGLSLTGPGGFGFYRDPAGDPSNYVQR